MPESVALAAAVQAGRWAAAACRAVRSASGLETRPEALDKQDKSPVTVADFAAQALVCRALAEAFPDDPVVGEEDAAALRSGDEAQFAAQVLDAVNLAGRQFGLPAATLDDVLNWIDRGGAEGGAGGGRFWTVDPIDGTKGFLRGGQYAVAIALIENGVPTVGVLACPNLPLNAGAGNSGTGALFAAEKGAGATVRSLEPDSNPAPIAASPQTVPAAARVCESVESGHTAHGAAAEIAERLGVSAEPLRLDSQAKYAEVARGGAEIYLRLPTRPGYVERIWDHAAGVAVIEEAGGRVTDVDGKPLDFTHGRGLETNRGVIATNGPLHAAVLEAAAAVLEAAAAVLTPRR